MNANRKGTKWELLLGIDESSWARARQQGRSAFIWRYNTVPYGLLGALGAALASYFSDGHSLADLLSVAFLKRVFFFLVILIPALYITYRGIWALGERRHGSR